MSADKHPAEVLAEWLDGYRFRKPADILRAVQAAEQLRRIPALEAERDQLHVEVMEQARLLGMSGERELALRAEIERLRKEVGALQADAERYRKLRVQNHTKTPRVSDPFEPGLGYLPRGLDAALDAIPMEVIEFADIDAARKQQ